PERADRRMGQRASERGEVKLRRSVHVCLACEVDLLLHRGERKLDVLATEQAAGGLILLQPREHALVSPAGDAGRDRAYRRAGAGEHDHRHRGAVALSTHDALIGDEHAVEGELSGGRRALAHLVLHAAYGEALAAGVDEKARPCFRWMPGVGRHEYCDPPGDAAVGDEPLDATQAEAAGNPASVTADPRALEEAGVLYVGPGLRLGDRKGH